MSQESDAKACRKQMPRARSAHTGASAPLQSVPTTRGPPNTVPGDTPPVTEVDETKLRRVRSAAERICAPHPSKEAATFGGRLTDRMPPKTAGPNGCDDRSSKSVLYTETSPHQFTPAFANARVYWGRLCVNFPPPNTLLYYTCTGVYCYRKSPGPNTPLHFKMQR